MCSDTNKSLFCFLSCISGTRNVLFILSVRRNTESLLSLMSAMYSSSNSIFISSMIKEKLYVNSYWFTSHLIITIKVKGHEIVTFVLKHALQSRRLKFSSKCIASHFAALINFPQDAYCNLPLILVPIHSIHQPQGTLCLHPPPSLTYDSEALLKIY